MFVQGASALEVSSGALVAHGGELIEFARNCVIFSEGQTPELLYVIRSGKVKIGRVAGSGREHLIALLGASDVIGELAIFDPGPQPVTATTVTEVVALALDREAVRSWIAQQPDCAEQFLRLLARSVRRTHSMVTDLIAKDVPGRLAKALLQLKVVS